jgi:hypothetical protein
MKLSIIIPTYNRAQVLPRAIKSILSQPIKDYEIIIVDDGSTDETWAGYFRWILFFNLKTMLYFIVKPLLIYIKHGFKESMPIKIELFRALYHGKILWMITAYKVKKILK